MIKARTGRLKHCSFFSANSLQSKCKVCYHFDSWSHSHEQYIPYCLFLFATRDASFFSRLSTYRNDNLAKILKLHKLSYPLIDNDLLRTYFHHLARRGVFPKPHKNTFGTEQYALHMSIRYALAIYTSKH